MVNNSHQIIIIINIIVVVVVVVVNYSLVVLNSLTVNWLKVTNRDFVLMKQKPVTEYLLICLQLFIMMKILSTKTASIITSYVIIIIITIVTAFIGVITTSFNFLINFVRLIIQVGLPFAFIRYLGLMILFMLIKLTSKVFIILFSISFPNLNSLLV